MSNDSNVIALEEVKARKLAEKDNNVVPLRKKAPVETSSLKNRRSASQLSAENDQRVRSMLEQIINGGMIPPNRTRTKGKFVDATDIPVDEFRNIASDDPIHADMAYLDSQIQAIADVCGEAIAKKIASGVIPVLLSAFEFGRFSQAISPQDHEEGR